MARAARRVNSRSEKSRIQNYEDGNAVRQISELPEEEYESRRSAKPRVSTQVRKNRVRARNISVGYVMFLAVICVATLFLCVNYLQMKATLTTQNETIASMESQLSKLKADNDAYYNQAMASVTLEDVKDAALNRLGMHYATESQIQYYDTTENSYVRQYQNVPNE